MSEVSSLQSLQSSMTGLAAGLQASQVISGTSLLGHSVLAAGDSANLASGGYLFVGHAESLTRVAHSLEYMRPAVYRKPEKRESKWNKSS